MKFELGQCLITPGAIDTLKENARYCYHHNLPIVVAATLLNRHITGDWGDMDEEDKQSNDNALKWGNRIFSSYKLANGDKLWVITEADRSATTILRPDEY